jgi:hypothetical protein
LPFLATPVLPDSYGNFTLEKLQDFYNIPRAEKWQKSPPSREKY